MAPDFILRALARVLRYRIYVIAAYALLVPYAASLAMKIPTEEGIGRLIVPSDPEFQRKADMLPPDTHRPQFYAVAAPKEIPAPGVPLMGVHWIDVRSPELQGMFGKPEAYKPFTTTFLYGSWEGRFIFAEPMITRAYILSKKAATEPAVPPWRSSVGTSAGSRSEGGSCSYSRS